MNNWERIEAVEKTVLDNGIRIVTEHVEGVRSVATGIWAETGSRDEPTDLAGITHFLEHMLFKGTRNRSAYDIALSMESVGGYMNAFTSNEYTCYYTRSLDSELERALDVLSDMVRNSVFPEDEIEKEKKVVLEEMKMYRDSPEDSLFEAFSGRIFHDHPLGRPIIGYEDSVLSLTREQLIRYVSDRYRPANLLVSVAGNVDHERVVNLVESLLNGEQQEPAVRKEQPLPDYQRHSERLTRPIEQTHMIIGKRGLHFDHKDKYLLLLANTVLGGGMSSRLHQNIREQYGYCYSIGTFNQSYTDSGLFGVYIGTAESYIDHVRELISEEFEKLYREPIPDKEFSEAKSQLKGKLLLSQESMSSRMTRLAKSEIYFNRFITLDELVEEIDNVSLNEVQTFASEFFDLEAFSETLLLPEKK
jgi:predicted Zn-dependent peptidase